MSFTPATSVFHFPVQLQSLTSLIAATWREPRSLYTGSPWSLFFFSKGKSLKKEGQGWAFREQLGQINSTWACRVMCGHYLTLLTLSDAYWRVFCSFWEYSADASFMMFPMEEITHSTCSGYRDQHPHTILYNILSGRKSDYLDGKVNRNATAHNCHCEQRRMVCLKDPKTTCQSASNVLIKTVCFVRSLPSFSQLPSTDQSLLLRHCWVPLFVLGLAQEKIDFEVTDIPNSSILRQILLGPGLTEKEADRPTLDRVHKLRTCLDHLWNLDLSPKEYAYLKGVVLFNPGKTVFLWVVFQQPRYFVGYVVWA